MSQTIVLDFTPKRPWPLIVAAAIAALAVLATLFWPGAVSRLFRLNTEGTVDQELQHPDPNATPAPKP